MSNRSEFEHRKKLNRIREDANKRVKEVRDHFVKIDKIRTQALGKTEEIRLSAQKDINRLEEEIKFSALAEDTKKALSTDIASLKKEVEDRATELRSRLTAISIPP